MKISGLALLFWAAAALAQFPFPGQQPYPGGYPPNGRRVPQQQPQQQQQQPQNSGRRSNRPATSSTDGMVRRVSDNQLVIEPDDHRVVWFHLTAQTSVQKDGAKASITSFQPGDRVSVDASSDDEGNLTAVEINWNRAGTAGERAAAQETWDLPGPGSASQASSGGTSARRDNSRNSDDDDRPILRRNPSSDDAPPPQAPSQAQAPPQPQAPTAQSQNAAHAPAAAANSDDDSGPARPATQMQPNAAPQDADDPGRPVLRRGGAATARQAAPAPAAADPAAASAPAPATNNGPTMVGRASDPPVRPQATSQANQQPILPQEDPLIEKVREAAYTYSASLPNFFCQQMTTRYASQNPRQGWTTLDLVTADVAYENGQERYRNIKVGNGRVVQSMDEVGGTRSSGEFSSVLQDLMSPATGAIFRRSGTDTIAGRSAIVFKLDVPRERSHWRVEAPSQLYYPAYRGSIWVDKDTSRVLRIELEARGLPSPFPFDTVESATDYDFIRLAAGERDYLLPANAEVLSCERGSSNCARNRIEFRNYKKFDAATSITFDK